MDAGSDEIPRRPLVEVATTGAVLGDRAEGGPPPLFPCSSPSAKSRWAASNKGGEGVGCAGGARRGHDGMGLLHLLLCRLTSSATMCLPHCSYHGSWCPFISGASAWRRAVACPPPSLAWRRRAQPVVIGAPDRGPLLWSGRGPALCRSGERRKS
jgi:hypothetical protein